MGGHHDDRNGTTYRPSMGGRAGQPRALRHFQRPWRRLGPRGRAARLRFVLGRRSPGWLGGLLDAPRRARGPHRAHSPRPAVSCVYYRLPFLLARAATDVDRLSGGRLVLGLGTGDHPREFQQLGLGDPPLRARYAALVETAQFVRVLWRGETVTMHGSYVHAEGAKLPSLPVQQPYVPMLIAGGGERRTLLHVVEHADACNFGPGSAWTDVDVKRKLEALQGHCATVGRPYNSVLRSHFTFPLIAAETEAALDGKLTARLGVGQQVEDQRIRSLQGA